MPFDEQLADRVRPLLSTLPGFEEKRMFGGAAFLLQGNMCTGVWQEFLIVRLGAGQHSSAMSEPHVRPFDITGRVMRGWAMVEPAGIEADEDLAEWVARAARFAGSLPPK